MNDLFDDLIEEGYAELDPERDLSFANLLDAEDDEEGLSMEIDE